MSDDGSNRQTFHSLDANLFRCVCRGRDVLPLNPQQHRLAVTQRWLYIGDKWKGKHESFWSRAGWKKQIVLWWWWWWCSKGSGGVDCEEFTTFPYLYWIYHRLISDLYDILLWYGAVRSGLSLVFLFVFTQEWTLEVRMEIYHLPLHHPSGRNHENPGL